MRRFAAPSVGGATPASGPPETSTPPPVREVALGETDLAHLLDWMDESDLVSLTITAGALKRAMKMAAGGPEVMSTAQAARVFGWTPKRWRAWAESGRIAGAWRDDRGRWRLPKAGCRAVAAAQPGAAASPALGSDPPVVRARPKDSQGSVKRGRSIRRGPRTPGGKR